LHFSVGLLYLSCIMLSLKYLIFFIYATCSFARGGGVCVDWLFFLLVSIAGTSRSRSSGTQVAVIRERAEKPSTLSLLPRQKLESEYLGCLPFRNGLRTCWFSKGTLRFPLPKRQSLTCSAFLVKPFFSGGFWENVTYKNFLARGEINISVRC